MELPTKSDFPQNLAAICIDLVSGYPSVSGKNAYLNVVDMHSSFAITFPCSVNTTAEQFSTLLEQQLFTRYGPAYALMGDRGPQLLVSAPIKKLCELVHSVLFITFIGPMMREETLETLPV